MLSRRPPTLRQGQIRGVKKPRAVMVKPPPASPEQVTRPCVVRPGAVSKKTSIPELSVKVRYVITKMLVEPITKPSASLVCKRSGVDDDGGVVVARKRLRRKHVVAWIGQRGSCEDCGSRHEREYDKNSREPAIPSSHSLFPLPRTYPDTGLSAAAQEGCRAPSMVTRAEKFKVPYDGLPQGQGPAPTHWWGGQRRRADHPT